MFKKIKSVTIALIITISFLTIVAQNSSYAATNNPASLKMYIGPTSVPADNNSYSCIFVQLLDSSGKPARATQDTAIGLSSSLTNIGTVQPSVTIPDGSTYVSTNFQTTFSPGTTTIAASASGFATVQSSVTTVGPLPQKVAVYGFPSILPADGNTYNAILVQLQDSSGSPAKAPIGGVQVSLSCSDNTVGSVTPSVIIPEGVTYATANFTTVYPTNKTLTALVNPIAQGYTPSPLQITTTPVASNPSQIKIFSGPSEIPADENQYPIVALELQNSTGFVCEVQSGTSVSLSSSAPTVAQINSQITIPAGQTYSVATLNTTYEPGTTTINAATNGVNSGSVSITTKGFTPSKLAVFCVPASLPSDNSTYSAIQVQLQDSNGNPALDPTGDATVSLSSSQPTVGTVSQNLTIPFGQTQATGTINVTNSAGATTITAQASGYTNGQATMTTYLIDFLPLQLTLNVTSPTVNNGAETNITTYITANGAPVPGVKLAFSSDSGGTFTTTSDEGNGYYTVTFTAASFTKTTTCTITATASKTGYANSVATTQICVQPSDSGSGLTSNSTSNRLQLLIQDSKGSPLSDVNVTSTEQPSGAAALSGMSNSTGYLIFQNVTTGSYTFRVTKAGYYQTFEAINMNGQPVAKTLSLNSDPSSSKGSSKGGNSLFIIIIAVVAVVVAVIAVLFILGRRDPDPEDIPSSTF